MDYIVNAKIDNKLVKVEIYNENYNNESVEVRGIQGRYENIGFIVNKKDITINKEYELGKFIDRLCNKYIENYKERLRISKLISLLRSKFNKHFNYEYIHYKIEFVHEIIMYQYEEL